MLKSLSEKLNGNLWEKHGKCRVYLPFGIKSAKITEKIWIEEVNGNLEIGSSIVAENQTPEFIEYRKKYLKTIGENLLKEAMKTASVDHTKPLGRLQDNQSYLPQWKTEPYSYQKRALEQSLSYYGYYLAMDMGLGKSKIALDNFATRKAADVVDVMIYITASSLKPTVAQQVSEHSNFDCKILNNKLDADATILICSYEQLSTPYRQGKYFEFLQNHLKCKRYLCVLDESSFINNAGALRSQNTLALAKRAAFVLLLNGTPINNCISDLWTQYYAIDGGGEILNAKTPGEFTDRHVITYQVYSYSREIGYKDKDKVMAMIAPYTFQLKKDEVLDLPDRIEKNFYFDLTTSQNQAMNEVYNLIQPDVQVFNPNAIIKYLAYAHQIAHGRTSELIGYRKLTCEKINLLQDLLKIQQFKKLIIFCNYIDEVKEIKAGIKDYKVFVLSGEISNKKEIEKAFELETENAVLVTTFGVGGRGKNWQFANDMLFYSPCWSYAKLSQAKDRIYRIGQNKQCRYFYFYANSFIDHCMTKAVNRKQDLDQYLYEYLNENNALAEFGTDHQRAD